MDFNKEQWEKLLKENDQHMNTVIPSLLSYIEDHLAPAVAERNFLKIAALLRTLALSANNAAEDYIIVAQAMALVDGEDK